jgi:anhydro-N-acetylmuramic acid kinase
LITPNNSTDKALYIGLMSGTSLDGIDAVLVASDGQDLTLVQTAYLPYPEALKQAILTLHQPELNELEHGQLVANQLTQLYASVIEELLALVDAVTRSKIVAIGCHGQTIRHRPELGFTVQLNNPALLAELTNTTVIADFRSRDIAAGGQGAPLVPAFHHALFAHDSIHRVVINIGGISNLTDLPVNGTVTGFDCGPGNLLMDAWCQRHMGQSYDRDGAWAKSGHCVEALLDKFMAHSFFAMPAPKSTGRDTFNMAWLEQYLELDYAPQDVQATLLELTVRSIADAILQYCGSVQEIYLCGGGAHNHALMERLSKLVPEIRLELTDELGVPVDWVEAAAFAWLAQQTMEGKTGNLPAVTGAAGPRMLGAIYPA